MSKFVGFIVGAAMVVVGVVTGNPYLIVQGGAMIVSNAIMLLTMPKQPARQASEMTIQLGEQPRSVQFGETYTAGSLVDGFNYGGKYGTDWEVLIIRLADHKCEGMTTFYVNDEAVRYTHDGNYAKFDKHHFQLYFRADTSTEPLPAIVTDNWPDYESSDVGKSGCDVIVAYLADSPEAEDLAWPGGRPRFGFVIKGKKCYDPRLDDTVPGGSGPHRWDDPETWEFSENPVVCRYNWVRGVYAEDNVTDQGALLVGRGLSAEEAPPENIIAAANLCDEDYDGNQRVITKDDGGHVGYNGVTSVSPDGTWYVRATDAWIEYWHLPSRTLVSQVHVTDPDIDVGTLDSIAVAGDGICYFVANYTVVLTTHSALFRVDHRGGMSYYDTAGAIDASPTRAFNNGTTGDPYVLTGVNPTWNSSGWLDAGILQSSPGLAGRDFAEKEPDNIWGLFQPSGSSAAIKLKQILGGTDEIDFTGLVTRSGPTTATFCWTDKYQHWFVVSDGKFYCVAEDGTIKTSGAWSGSTRNLPRTGGKQVAFWSGYSLISLEDGSVLRTIDASDWVNEDSSGGVDYDPPNNALITHAQFTDYLTWRELNAGFKYRIAGPVYSNQTFIDVEEMFAAAVAGNVVTREGSVELEPAQAKSVVASFTDDDILVGSQVTWNQGILSESNGEWVNTVVARYVEPRQKWNDHAAPVVRDYDDIIADGKPREAQITLRLVRDEDQALRVAEIHRRLGRIWGRAVVTLGPRFCELEDGDWVSWTSARFGFTKTFRIDAYSIDEKWQVKLTLREIHSSAYDVDNAVFDWDQSIGSPQPPLPEIGAPEADNWALTAITLDSAGASIPALHIEGSSDDDAYVSTIIFEYWKDDGVTDPTDDPDLIPWISAGARPPSTTQIDITSVVGGETYYAAVSYIVDGARGERLVLGPVTLTDFNANPYLHLEDGTTLIHLEDDTATFQLG